MLETLVGRNQCSFVFSVGVSVRSQISVVFGSQRTSW